MAGVLKPPSIFGSGSIPDGPSKAVRRRNEGNQGARNSSLDDGLFLRLILDSLMRNHHAIEGSSRPWPALLARLLDIAVILLAIVAFVPFNYGGLELRSKANTEDGRQVFRDQVLGIVVQ